MKKLIILTFAFILLSCSQNNQTNTANKNLSIMVDSQTVCAVFNNLWQYELFVYNEQNNLIESKVLKFVTNSKKNKILREMNQSKVIALLGEPAIKTKNKYFYFQNYLDVTLFKLSYGIDKRVLRRIYW